MDRVKACTQKYEEMTITEQSEEVIVYYSPIFMGNGTQSVVTSRWAMHGLIKKCFCETRRLRK